MIERSPTQHPLPSPDDLDTLPVAMHSAVPNDIRRGSRKYQRIASTKLAGQALEALHELLRGFQAANVAVQGALLDEVAREDPSHLYSGLMASLLRLVFVLYAEARGLFPEDEIYVRNYSLTRLFETLRIDAKRSPETIDQRHGAWSRLCALFRLIHDGAHDGSLHLPARKGQLFDPDKWPFLEAPKVGDGVVYRVLEKLLILDGNRLCYRTLDVEQIGCVYETLMDFTLASDHGELYLRPTDERRRSGSHYTPRELTEPIVRKTLAPLLAELGSAPTPQQILALKVCDPAMGSGAFLIEVCRQLGNQLARSWVVYGKPAALPLDEDPQRFARRQVAQCCLYGIDKNPFAVELGKLSLWLTTRSRELPFTFLDHAVRHGDSLVGLSQAQLASIKGPLEDRRLIADCTVACFFAEQSKPKRRLRNQEWQAKIAAFLDGKCERQDLVDFVATLRQGPRSIPAFHWALEFPEVFQRECAGFDAFIGNPPFLGGRKISASFGDEYLDWLMAAHPSSHGNADLVAHFFRRAFELLRPDGTLGFVATNTIAQGDTRNTGLRWLCTNQGTIYEAIRRHQWPGQAAVVVSTVHVRRGAYTGPKLLDGRPVDNITAFLFHAGGHDDPAPLSANANKSFQGNVVLGMGFTFDDENLEATSLAQLQQLLAKNPHNGERIFPFIGGEEINSSPTHAHSRFIIDFNDMSLEAAAKWPDLLAILREKVLPARRQKRGSYAKQWWLFGRRSQDCRRVMQSLNRVLVNSQVSSHIAFAFQPTDRVFAHSLNVFALPQFASFAILQSRLHEVWARFCGSSMKDDPRYTPSDCFETFPFPAQWESSSMLEDIGKKYYELRAQIMVRNNEGLTTTYNRFHDPDDDDAQIVELRAQHAALDRAVLNAYGWIDLRPVCEFLLNYDVPKSENANKDGRPRRRKKPWRYRWPDAVRDEVLARLLSLHAERADNIR